MAYVDYNVAAGVNVGFTSIMIVPLIAIMCITYARAPRSKDPARVSITYFKVLLPLAILWLFMFMIQGILSIVYRSNYFNGTSTYHAEMRLYALGSLFSYLGDILLVMTLIELGNGFLFCLTETRTGLQKAMRYLATGTCAIIAMLVIVYFGILNAEYTQYLAYWSYNYNNQLYGVRRNIGTALTIIMFVWSLVIMVFAVIVFKKAKRNYVLKNSAMLYLVAAILYLATHLYMFIYTCIFILSYFYMYSEDTSTALMFIDPILSVWIFVAVVSLVCAIMARKHNGLWATLQPWMGGQVPPALAANPSSKNPGEQWQQPSNSHVTGV